MDDLMDMLVNDESPAAITDKIKDLLYDKAMGKIETLRPHVSSALFSDEESEE